MSTPKKQYGKEYRPDVYFCKVPPSVYELVRSLPEKHRHRILGAYVSYFFGEEVSTVPKSLDGYWRAAKNEADFLIRSIQDGAKAQKNTPRSDSKPDEIPGENAPKTNINEMEIRKEPQVVAVHPPHPPAEQYTETYKQPYPKNELLQELTRESADQCV